jgi:inner membrane protein
MPTVITHAAVPLAIGLGAGQRVISRRLLIAGIVASMLPDLDTLEFRFGIPYGSPFGHRGFTHSFVFAGVVAIAAAVFHRFLYTSRWRAFAFVFVSAASHGILDTFTTGGKGVALLWPFTNARYFAPVRMIQVSPIGVGRFLSRNEGHVIATELLWVWLPMLLLFLLLRTWCKHHQVMPNPRRQR